MWKSSTKCDEEAVERDLFILEDLGNLRSFDWG